MTNDTLPVDPYDFVRALSLAHRVLDVGHNPQTQRTYRATLNVMAENGLSPRDLARSRSRFNEACAATVYAAACALTDLGGAAYEADPVVLNREADRVQAAVSILLRYGAGNRPAGRPGRAGADSAGTGRAAARWLARARRYRRGDLLRTAIRHQWSPDALAVLEITGARPAALAQGVAVRLAGTKAQPALVFGVPGTKHDPARNKGTARQEIRVPLHAEQPAMCHLAKRLWQARSTITVACPEDRLRRDLKAAAEAVFGPVKGGEVTPYTLRHVVAARLRVQAGTEVARRTLGHRTVESTLVYGGAPDQGPLPEAVLWPEDTPEPGAEHSPDAMPVSEPEAPAPAGPPT
ncbi:hypothetical protein CKO21_05395 [Rhodovibrio salinarum]|uniref:Phage integrase family protein n=2 Tax=Rhodovibrio salinarum TaxID=1087 RepID=A0A934UZR2_9PROT|nr:hypothetical protein [Rhodovibrio salinarum]